jgi:hypothetical protein
LERRKIHVAAGSLSQKSTSKESAQRFADTTGNVAELRRVEVARKQLKEALRKLDQIEFELQGGCTW